MNSRPVLRGLALALLGTVCCVVLVGCGGGTGDITGKVTVNGTVVKGGTVTFITAGEGPAFTGLIEEDGTYTVRGVRAGNYKVCVETETLRSKAKGGGSTPPPGKGPKGAPGGSGPPDFTKAAKNAKSGADKDSQEPEDVRAKHGKDGFATMADNARRYVPIPASYASPDTTELTYTATSGSQTFNLELKGK